MTRTIDAVVFDYGGVLTTPMRAAIAAWVEEAGIDPASFSRVLKRWLSRSAPEGTPIHRLETGELTAAEFDPLLAAELTTTDGGPVEPHGLLSALFAHTRGDQQMFDLVRALRRAGVRVALLSNSWGNSYPRAEIDALFDPVVISSEVGLRKPQPEIFTHTLRLLDLPAERVVFVDDAEPNLRGAERVGLHTVLHTDAATTHQHLAALVPNLSAESRQLDSRQTSPSLKENP